MDNQRNIAHNEHTLSILSGLAKLEALYGMTMDEMDYLDIALGALRDINNYGVTPYIAYVDLDDEGEADLPCNLDSIVAVVETGVAEAEYGDRIVYDNKAGEFANDEFYREREIFYKLGRFGAVLDMGNRSWLDTTFKGYIPYFLSNDNKIKVSGRKGKIAVVYDGIVIGDQGYPMITRKQSNALAAQAAKSLIYKGSYGGNKLALNMLQLIISDAGRLMQAASIPEQITDNELDDLLDAKVSFGRKRFGRYGKIGR